LGCGGTARYDGDRSPAIFGSDPRNRRVDLCVLLGLDLILATLEHSDLLDELL
jgi:hypothetical protein